VARPPVLNPCDHRLRVYLPEAAADEIARQALEEGLSASAWARRQLLALLKQEDEQ
jgi:hypothetical protein